MVFGMRSKLFISFVVIATLGILGIGIGSFYLTKSYLQNEAFEQLTSLREMKQQQIEAYFAQVRGQASMFSKDLMTVDAMNQFSKNFPLVEKEDQYTPEQLKQMTEKLKKFYNDVFLPKLNANLDEKIPLNAFFEDISNDTVILQNLYIVDNPYPNQRIDFDRAPDKSTYTKVHAKFNPLFREFLRTFEYYDLFLIDAKTGYVVYNASKEVDFASNITKGPFKDTNLAQGFFEVQQATDKDFVKFVDFQFYIPSRGMPSAFVMSPIYDGDKKVGILALQLNIEEINRIMTNDKKWKSTGLGDTGESYIIGDDYKMRSDSRFLIQNPEKYFKDLEKAEVDNNILEKMRLLNTTILIQDITTESAQEVIRGNSDTRLIIDYRGIPNISSYTPLQIEDANWGIIAEMDHRELLDTVSSFGWRLFGIGAAVLLAILLLSLVLMYGIMRPLYGLLAGLRLINRENHTNIRERLDVDGNDVIAQVSDQMNVILGQVQKGFQALMLAKKELSTYAKRMKDGVERSATSAQSIEHAEQQEKEQVQKASQLLSSVQEGLASHAATHATVEQNMQNIAVACGAVNRAIEAIQSHVQKTEATSENASLRTLLDEGLTAERGIKKEMDAIQKRLEKARNESKEAEQAVHAIQAQLSGIESLEGSAVTDSKKMQAALDQINAALEKIKDATAEFEKTTRNFTV